MEHHVFDKTRSRRQILTWILALILIGSVSFIVWKAVSTPRGSGLLHALPPLLLELHGDEQRLGQVILDNYQEYRSNARNWSAVYFGCLFFSAVCAALAGVVIKLEFVLTNEGLKKDLAAVLAMVAALLITLSTVGGFHQRWWANRLAAAKIEKLGYAFITDRSRNLDAFSSQVQTISFQRNAEIVSSDSDHQAIDSSKENSKRP